MRQSNVRMSPIRHSCEVTKDQRRFHRSRSWLAPMAACFSIYLNSRVKERPVQPVALDWMKQYHDKYRQQPDAEKDESDFL